MDSRLTPDEADVIRSMRHWLSIYGKEQPGDRTVLVISIPSYSNRVGHNQKRLDRAIDGLVRKGRVEVSYREAWGFRDPTTGKFPVHRERYVQETPSSLRRE